VPRLAVLGVFFANGFVIGTWVVRIPAVQQRLGPGEGLLGLALLGATVGALAAMPLVGALVSRFGSRRVVGATALLLPLSLVVVLSAAGEAVKTGGGKVVLYNPASTMNLTADT
jgi:MFS family permease